MKLLKDIVNRVIDASNPVQAIAGGLKSLAESFTLLAHEFATLAYNQEVHNNMIMQMWQTHQLLLRKVAEGSVDTQMPDIEPKKQSSDDKGKAN